MRKMIIESTENKKYKYLKGLLNKKDRKKEKIFMAEGIKVISESLSHVIPRYIAISSKLENDADVIEIIEKAENSNILIIDEKIFNNLSDTKNSQGIIGYYDFIHRDSLSDIKSGKYIFLDDIKDPGNLGGVIRSAEAFSMDGVILSRETVDIYNPKVIRSTMASVFRVPIYIVNEKSEVLKLKENFRIVSTAFENSVSSDKFDYDGNIVLVIGNEAHGVSDEVFDMSDVFLKIPMSPNINSLNANVAASILMYEMSIHE